MKKFIIYSALVITVLGFVFLYHIQKKTYEQNYLSLSENILFQIVYIPDQTFSLYGKYVDSMNQLVDSLAMSGYDEEYSVLYLGDPFNQYNKYLSYIPLYNRKLKKAEGYILLSAGIDGKINNVFKDSIYLDEDIQLRLYDKSDTTFCITKRWFGNKDWLISKVDGRQQLVDQAMPTEIQSLVKQAKALKINDTRLKVRIGDRIVKLDTVVYFCYQDIWIKNYPLEYDLIRPYQIGDSISIAGVFRGWENDSTIKMINCIPVGDN
ncbi:MAG: hypothetical protein LBQ60_21455 [Bacteroidales bacterium]|jgi:hypothetical protein|nr:hypothetical protein [Bacteroidales bacterium]